MNDWPRFTVHSSLVWNDSFNVVDNERRNPRTGEPWVELCAVTLEEAEAKARELNDALPVQRGGK